MRVRFSRPCYDKFHRCPGWIGGGPRYAKRKRCEAGRIRVDYDDRWWAWKFWPCDECNVVVLPYHSRKLSIPFLVGEARWKLRNWREDRR